MFPVVTPTPHEVITMSDERMTLDAFIALAGLTMTTKPSPTNPHLRGSAGMDHFFCTIASARAAHEHDMTVFYSMGKAHRVSLGGFPNPYPKGKRIPQNLLTPRTLHDVETAQLFVPRPPTLPEVLSCLAMDANGVENADSFEDWANEYGYDTDSRKAEESYNATRKQTRDLKAMLGREWFNLLLSDVEADQ